MPLLAEQIEEYASGQFKEEWFEIAFAPAGLADRCEQKREALERAFQVNENLVHRWPRFAELQSQVRSAGAEACVGLFQRPRNGAICNCFRSSPGWTRNIWRRIRWCGSSPKRARISRKKIRQLLLEKQHELLAAVLPEYRLAAARGQIEISTTPYYHPILPLLCDTDIARVSNPHTPLPHPPFVIPKMRASNSRARGNFTSGFSASPRWDCGLRKGRCPIRRSKSRWNWDSNGSPPTKECWAARRTSDSGATPAAIRKMVRNLYTPWRLKRGKRER